MYTAVCSSTFPTSGFLFYLRWHLHSQEYEQWLFPVYRREIPHMFEQKWFTRRQKREYRLQTFVLIFFFQLMKLESTYYTFSILINCCGKKPNKFLWPETDLNLLSQWVFYKQWKIQCSPYHHKQTKVPCQCIRQYFEVISK